VRRVLAIDFDGVIYGGEWLGVTTLEGSPVLGVINFLAKAVIHYDVIVHTARLQQGTFEGVRTPNPFVIIGALRQWMISNGFSYQVVNQLDWWTGAGKPYAHLYIDDRGFRFEGIFPTFEEIDSLIP